jgi:hypothetical protein
MSWVSLTLGVVVAMIALGGVAVITALEDLENKPSGKPIIIHIHATLRISIDGQSVVVPEGIGMVPQLYKSHELDRYGIKDPRTYPLHTHDTSGMIHIESNDVRTFTLGQFFDVWGKRLNENCILDKCNNGSDEVRMYVDGVESSEFRDHVFKNGEVITIEYGVPRGQHPL